MDVKVDPRAAARFDFLLRFHAKEAGIAWLSSLTTWGYKQGVGLAEAIALQNPDNVESANKLLEAAEAIGVLRRGNVDLSHTGRACAGLRYGGPTFGRGTKSWKLTDPHPVDHAWQLTELGEAYFRWLASK